MTAILYADNQLAADRQINGGHGGTMERPKVEIYECKTVGKKRKHKAAIAIAGDLTFCDPMVDWYVSGADPEEWLTVFEQGESAIYVMTKDDFLEYDTVPYPKRWDFGTPLGFATGGFAALAAYYACNDVAGAIEAVNACSHISGYGYDIVHRDQLQ